MRKANIWGCGCGSSHICTCSDPQIWELPLQDEFLPRSAQVVQVKNYRSIGPKVKGGRKAEDPGATAAYRFLVLSWVDFLGRVVILAYSNTELIFYTWTKVFTLTFKGNLTKNETLIGDLRIAFASWIQIDSTRIRTPPFGVEYGLRGSPFFERRWARMVMRCLKM